MYLVTYLVDCFMLTPYFNFVKIEKLICLKILNNIILQLTLVENEL